jgi:hypothetical protein
MLYKKNYKVVIIIEFLLHQRIISKIFLNYRCSLKYWIFIRAVEIDTYYVLSFMKGS